MSKLTIFPPTTLGLFGDTGSGKSTSLAKVAEYLFIASQGTLVHGQAQGGLRTLVYLYDGGSIDPYNILFNTGIATLIDCRSVPFPHLALEHLGRGLVPAFSGKDEKVKQHSKESVVPGGQWVTQDLSDIGFIIHDSGSAFADQLFSHLSELAGEGMNIGGEGAMSFTTGSAEWGKVTVGSSNKAHYGIVQNQMQRFIGYLGALAAKEQCLVAMTFAVDRGNQESSAKQVVGPLLKGGAKTAVAPGWFGLCFHLDVESLPGFKAPMPVLYTATRVVNGVSWLANRRLPLPDPNDAAAMREYDAIPARFAPADLVAAFKVLQAERAKAEAKLIAKLSA